MSPDKDPEKSLDPAVDVDASTVNEPTVDHPKDDTSLSHHQIPDPPDGGLVAWLQVLAGFFMLFNTWGIVNSYGAFQTFYETDLLSSKSPSAIAWVGSIQGFLLLLIGSLTGPIFDLGYFRSLLFTGSFMVVFGMMMTSLSTQYYQVFLAQGVCVGLGAGCLFIPSVAVLATYWSKRRAMAIGIAASGSSIGGIVYPALFHQLQPRIGFAWATRVIAFIALATLTLCIIVMKRRVTTSIKRKLFDWTALREPPFVLFTAGLFLGFMGVYIPFYYISPYAIQKTSSSANLAFYFIPILNAGSVFGRIVPNIIADKMGSINTLIPCAFACAILAFSWIAVESTGGLLAFAILYGFFSGSFVSLPPSALVGLAPDMRLVGTRMGMSFSVAGLGVLIGTPVAGAILNIPAGQYLHAQIFCAVIALVGAIFLTAARIAKVGTALMAKT
ncbi:MFS general substrate transporter [Artomyces pyxidatus]|uniref:MFS general substrate transporter n=1 Tax=Artomyces pyxidatus TaxID=48021 RepID=A0ACB8TGB6_9AGAM|nr:MFS general substrate transporter [Artomyces pyxidatus]